MPLQITGILLPAILQRLRRGIPALLLTGPFLLLFSACGNPDARSSSTAMLLPENIGDWVKQDAPVTYDRETIFDYINGAGEVYRSFAFRDVLVQTYGTPEGRRVTVEVFDMGNPEDAFGVFSYAREDEEE